MRIEDCGCYDEVNLVFRAYDETWYSLDQCTKYTCLGTDITTEPTQLPNCVTVTPPTTVSTVTTSTQEG